MSRKKPPLLRAESSVKRVVKKQKDYPSAVSSKLLGLLTHFDAIVAKSPAYHSLESAFSTMTITSVLNENRSEANIPETKVPQDIVVLLETAIKNFGAEFDGNGTTLGGMGSATFSALESVKYSILCCKPFLFHEKKYRWFVGKNKLCAISYMVCEVQRPLMLSSEEEGRVCVRHHSFSRTVTDGCRKYKKKEKIHV